MTTHKRIADLVIAVTGVNIYETSRRQDVVDARSLFEFIMHKRLKYTLSSISNFYRHNGKSRHYSTIIYSCKLFDEVCFRKPDYADYLNQIVGTELTKLQYQNAYDLVGKLNTKKQLKKFRKLMREIIADANV